MVSPLVFSKSMAKDAQRQAGVQLMVLWPEALGPEPTNLIGHEVTSYGDGVNSRISVEREATPAEKIYAGQLVAPACAVYDLRIEEVVVIRERRYASAAVAPNEVRTHLAILLLGRRWRKPVGNPVVRWP